VEFGDVQGEPSLTASDDMSVLLLTGTVATGKTTIAVEIGEMFPPARAIICIDLDKLGWGFIPDAPRDRIFQLRVDNLAAIWPNVRSAGFRHVVLSGAIETAEALEHVRQAIAPSQLTVVRLVTPPTMLESRLRRRDAGRLLEDHLAMLPTIERAMDRANIGDVRVTNDERSPREVALEILERIGWA
jgi:adenylylsulfate kinase-like enzyme